MTVLSFFQTNLAHLALSLFRCCWLLTSFWRWTRTPQAEFVWSRYFLLAQSLSGYCGYPSPLFPKHPGQSIHCVIQVLALGLEALTQVKGSHVIFLSDLADKMVMLRQSCFQRKGNQQP